MKSTPNQSKITQMSCLDKVESCRTETQMELPYIQVLHSTVLGYHKDGSGFEFHRHMLRYKNQKESRSPNFHSLKMNKQAAVNVKSKLAYLNVMIVS